MNGIAKHSLLSCEILWAAIVAIGSWSLLRDSNSAFATTIAANRGTLIANCFVALIPIVIVETYRRTSILHGFKSAGLGWLVLGLVVIVFWRNLALAAGYVYLYVLMPFGLLVFRQWELTAPAMAAIGVLLTLCLLHAMAASIGRALMALRVRAK